MAQVDVLSKWILGFEAQVMEKEKNFFLRKSKHGNNHGGMLNDDSLSVIQQNLEE